MYFKHKYNTNMYLKYVLQILVFVFEILPNIAQSVLTSAIFGK